ncbi:hypothetical protein AQUCO_00200983v1 [Aquilegia coerulea]|uniref:BHLH domain-containing protein n=1 Tax=Aquilegia coerulea TaxID=218851 RepID=A0A2G5F5N9_AQUCA|nr:hypothetical protein AQUCO_00200983v1 [Aquilegia coerulea]
MDLGDKDKFGIQKRGVDSLNYHSPNVSSDWRFGDSNQPLGLVTAENSAPISKGDLMGTSMVDSFWDHPNSQNLGFIDNNVHQVGTSTSNTVIRKGVPVTLRTGIENSMDMGWNSPNLMLRGGAFLQSNARNLPPSLSEFPADSAFIERAARFSCFNGGNFGDIVNPFNISESLNPYSKGRGPVQGPQEVLSANGMSSLLAAESQKSELNMAEMSKDHSMSVEHGATGGSPVKNDIEKRGQIGMSSNESGEGEFSGGGQGEHSIPENDGGEPSSSKGISTKKRKRAAQNAEIDQDKGASQHSGEAKADDKSKEKGGQNINSATNKSAGKHGKDVSQASDAPKEDYIHIRARRGQATNSHSLAERVRREKISERMKFLQELVPGCSKVTGKAVMLDEIINYVQSLQRQVEFLSMKLATVNPRLDFNIEGILGKDSRSGPSTLGFSPDMSMVHPQMHPSQQALLQTGIPGVGNSSDALRRTINSQLAALNSGYKDLMPQNHQQIATGWDDELHNVVQMGFGTNGPFNNQDLNGPLPPGHMKVEL